MYYGKCASGNWAQARDGLRWGSKFVPGKSKEVSLRLTSLLNLKRVARKSATKKVVVLYPNQVINYLKNTTSHRGQTEITFNKLR